MLQLESEDGLYVYCDLCHSKDEALIPPNVLKSSGISIVMLVGTTVFVGNGGDPEEVTERKPAPLLKRQQKCITFA